jgi:inner membrane protein
MDPLTHTLVGAALGRAGLNRWCPRAAALLMVAANAPDIDVVTAAGGSLAYLDYHRQITHSLTLVPVLAVLSVGVVSAYHPSGVNLRRNWLRMMMVALAGVLVHLLLDWTNVYGVRLLLPFSGSWKRLDITHVVDLWVWVILLLAFVAPFLSRLVAAEIGGRRGSGRGAAILSLLLLAGYDGARVVLHQRAVAVLESRIYAGEAPLRVIAVPGPFHAFRWRGLVETGSAWLVFDLNLLGEFDPSAGQVLGKPEASRALEAARASEVFRHFLAFSQAPYWRVIPMDEPEHSVRVEAMDLRFGLPAERRFLTTAQVDREGRVTRAEFRFGPVGRR